MNFVRLDSKFCGAEVLKGKGSLPPIMSTQKEPLYEHVSNLEFNTNTGETFHALRLSQEKLCVVREYSCHWYHLKQTFCYGYCNMKCFDHQSTSIGLR